MSKTSEDFNSAMVSAINAIDPSIDVAKGPVKETSLIPWSTEFAYLDGKVEHLGQLYQFEDVSGWSEEEISIIGRKYGIDLGQGTYSQGFLTFWTQERPSTDIIIPLGSLASTVDSKYIFKTIEEGTIYTSTADAFYNSEKRRYEISLAAEAVIPGSGYDVKKNRVSLLLSTISGITGVVNNADFSEATSEQNIYEFVETLKDLTLGNSLGSPGGINGIIRRSAVDSIYDSTVLTPADIGVFERLSDTGIRAAIDIYILGQKIGLTNYSYVTISASEKDVILPKAPVLSVTNVMVDGVAANFTFSSDTDLRKRGSTLAQDKITLDTAPGVGKNVFVTYSYNKLIEECQTIYDNVENELFNTDTLIREGKKVETTVEVISGPLTTGVTSDDIEDSISAYFKDPDGNTAKQRFIQYAYPEEVEKRVLNETGIKIRITKFYRPDNAVSLVEDIYYQNHEYPDPLNITINIG